jgi:GNAT superfamily N-acetyltransferase
MYSVNEKRVLIPDFVGRNVTPALSPYDAGMVGIPPDVQIRRARASDVAELGELGAALMRTHYAFDSRRFLAPGGDDEAGYASFLGAQLDDDESVILVAARAGKVVGYVYAAIEPLSWKDLRAECGYVHDLLVIDAVRGTGIADALLDAAMDWLRARGMPRVMLGTAAPNERARRLFERRGFRPTMIEMTLEL